MLKTILFILSISVSLAGTDPFILIRGTVGGSFDSKQVKVKDSFGQVYSLPRSVFPSDFVPESGKAFSVQVPEVIIKELKIEKQKK